MILPQQQAYPLASTPFWTLNGEGHLRGFQMLFLRLAGCSVGCPNCDTDYKPRFRHSVSDVVSMCLAATPTSRDKWVWITGGEPTDHDLRPLIGSLSAAGFSCAVATAGHKRFIPPVAWLSVSPHDPDKWVQLYGNEVKIVPGLNGFGIDDFIKAHPDDQTDFMYRYVQPLWDTKNNEEDRNSLKDCLAWLKHHPNWSLSRQDHKWWGVD